MIATWSRRAHVALAAVMLSLLAACGSSTIESALTPSRILVVGDAFSDLGQSGTRYTVNDGSANSNWTEQLASQFGLSVTASGSGGLSYARAHARIASAVDAVGGSAPSIRAQIDSLLAANTLGANDVVLVQGGVSDMIAEMASGADTATVTTNLKQAGRDLGAQVRRLVTAGAKHVAVVGVYNMGQSRWAIETGRRDLFHSLSTSFNEALLVSIADLGANVLYIDAALYFNLVTTAPSAYGLTDAANAPDSASPPTPVIACNSVDAGVGIGTGTGQVNSALCTTSTLTAGVTYTTTLFADRVYFTPVAQRLFGSYAYTNLRQRW